MRESILVKLAFGMPTLIALAGVPFVPVGAHEGHQMECNETNLKRAASAGHATATDLADWLH